MSRANPFIRDHIQLTRADALLDVDPNADVIYLIARRVSLEPGVCVQVPRPLVIVADEFDGQGGWLLGVGQGHEAPASPGADGAPEGQGVKQGRAGQDGAPGGAGQSITVVCRRHLSLQVDVSGGTGQSGGTGGRGGAGRNAHLVSLPGGGHGWELGTPGGEETDPGNEPPRRPTVHNGATAGGAGGGGGRGGAGGAGGRLALYTLAEVVTAQLQARGGAGGAAGAHGAPGPNGQGYIAPAPAHEEAPEEPFGEPPPPPPSRDGAAGADGEVIALQLPDESSYLAQLRDTLGIYANHWAPFRIAMGEYHLRRHHPALGNDSGRLAAAELEAALALQPDNLEAQRLHRQLVEGHNILGLPFDLDIRPLFNDYIQSYAAFSNLLLPFMEVAATEVVAAVLVDAQKEQVVKQAGFAKDHEAKLKDAMAQLDQAQTAADEELRYRQQQLDDLNAQIKAALETVKDQPFNLFGLLGTLGSIGSAVVGIIAAIPSAGASLVALAPSVVALGKSVLDRSDDVTKALFERSSPEHKALAEKYGQVGQQVQEVVALGKQVVDFVRLVDSLTQVATPDNSAYLALVRQGAVAAHEVLLARRQCEQLSLRRLAQEAELARAANATAELNKLAETFEGTDKDLLDVARWNLAVMSAHIDSVLQFAFHAQRAFEIVTVKDAANRVDLTLAVLSPDLRRDHEEGLSNGAAMLKLMVDQWKQVLAPTQLVVDFNAFRNADVNHDVLRLNLSEASELQALRGQHQLSLDIDVRAHLPGRLQTKITQVTVALVGARSRSGAVSCEVSHGARYGQLLEAGGELSWQLLRARTITRQTTFTSLTTVDELGDPEDLAFWGRGLGGTWTLAIADAEWQRESLDLSGLSQIQLWIGYQYLRG